MTKEETSVSLGKNIASSPNLQHSFEALNSHGLPSGRSRVTTVFNEQPLSCDEDAQFFCEEVVFEVAFVRDIGQSGVKQLHNFYCINPGYRRLQILKTPLTFASEWKAARDVGETTFVACGTAFDKNKLVLSESNKPNNYEWRAPLASPAINIRRLLDLDYSKERDILVLRITVQVDSESIEPSKSAAEVSASVFGNENGDSVSLASQYADCSYNILQFKPAVLSDTSASPGVLDITVTTTNFTHIAVETAAVAEAVQVLGSDSFGNIDHLIFHVPHGVTYDGSEEHGSVGISFHSTTDWLAFGDVVSPYSIFLCIITRNSIKSKC